MNSSSNCRSTTDFLGIMADSTAQILPDPNPESMSAASIADWTFEQLKVGMSASFLRIISADDVDRFAALSGDVSPIHSNDEAAMDRGLDGRIVHGMLLGALASQMVGVHLPGSNSLLQSMKMTFVKSVSPGEELLVSGCIEAISPATRTVVVRIKILSAKEHRVMARGVAQVGLLEVA